MLQVIEAAAAGITNKTTKTARMMNLEKKFSLLFFMLHLLFPFFNVQLWGIRTIYISLLLLLSVYLYIIKNSDGQFKKKHSLD